MRVRLHEKTLMVPSSEQFSKNAASCPEVDLNAVVSVSVQKFWSSVIPSRDVGHASSWQGGLVSLQAFEYLVVVVQLLRAAKVTYF